MMNSWLSIAKLSAASCTSHSFFGIPPWYKYLNTTIDADGGCSLQFSGLGDFWLAVAGITEIALRVAVLLSIIFVIVGGIMYITSQGNPESTARANKVLSMAILGLVISIAAVTVVSFIAGKF